MARWHNNLGMLWQLGHLGGQARTAADSSSDSNTGVSRRPTTSGSGGGVQVRNAYERL
jgi:hypothetical protein